MCCCSYPTYDILLLRITLAMAGLLFLLWAVIVLDIALDTAIWFVPCYCNQRHSCLTVAPRTALQLAFAT